MGGTDPGRLATMAKEITIFHCDASMVASNSTIGYSPPVLTNKVATKKGRFRHCRVRPGGGGGDSIIGSTKPPSGRKTPREEHRPTPSNWHERREEQA